MIMKWSTMQTRTYVASTVIALATPFPACIQTCMIKLAEFTSLVSWFSSKHVPVRPCDATNGTQDMLQMESDSTTFQSTVCPRENVNMNSVLALLGANCFSLLQEGILSIAHGVAMGMAYMHSLSICHGDLK
jgi:hypothetical protein